MFILNSFKSFILLIKKNILIFLQVIASFLIPIKILIYLVGLMIIIDTISGIWKAKKTGEALTSHKLSRAISKMLLYQLALITFFILEKYLLGEFVLIFTAIPYFLTKVVAVFISFVEIVSINENITIIYGFNFLKEFKNFLFRAKKIKKELED